MTYFDKKDNLFDIIEKYPETLPVFISNGFNQMESREKREQFGKAITLEISLLMKQINYESFSRLLVEAIESKNSSVDATLAENRKSEKSDTLDVVGLLPCPVRIPLLESFNKFKKGYSNSYDIEINHELKAASMGLKWVEDNIKGISDSSKLPDLFISAGFDMFFDKKVIGKFKDEGAFKDSTKFKEFNSSFSEINLRDPKKHYSMIGVVPAVFLINLKELGDLPLPKTWKDILNPQFINRVSLPVGDFDLFNAILLNIHKMYGDEGVKKLGMTLLESLHPSQMVKSDKMKNNRPIITIMPYFFTKMVKEGGSMVAVWPEDGAILSPIFMLSKKEKIKQLQPIIDFFSSEEVAKILSHNGLFPAVNPNIDNRLKKENKFMWLGWDYIYDNDIGALIEKCLELFESSISNEEKL